MNLLRDLPSHDDDGNLLVVVEVCAGSRVKLKYDPRLEAFVWSRALTVGVVYPWDYGFVPRTASGDGDALDVLVYSHAGPTHPGVVVPARPIGALRVEQRRGAGPVKRNDRLLVVPVDDHVHSDLREVADLPRRAHAEIEEFFRASLALTGKDARARGWGDAAEAAELVADACARFSGGPVGAAAKRSRSATRAGRRRGRARRPA